MIVLSALAPPGRFTCIFSTEKASRTPLRGLVCIGARFLSKTAVSLAATGSRGDAPGHLVSRSSVPSYFSTASSGISRVPVEPFAGMPCSQTPAEPPRQAIAASRCCPPIPKHRRTPASRSFRDSITRPSCSLCTLRAAIADDYATLAFRLVATFAGPPLPCGRVHQVNFVALQHLL